VTQTIQHEWTDLGLLECLPVLPLEAAWFNMSALRRSWPHPALKRFTSGLPARFEDMSDPRCHGKHAACCPCFPVGHEQRAMPHLGMDRGHVSEIENGKRVINLLTLQTVASGLDTTMAKLLRGL
jgi:hypothetical protein